MAEKIEELKEPLLRPKLTSSGPAVGPRAPSLSAQGKLVPKKVQTFDVGQGDPLTNIQERGGPELSLESVENIQRNSFQTEETVERGGGGGGSGVPRHIKRFYSYISEHNYKAVKKFMNTRKMNITVMADERGYTPAHTAAQSNSYVILEFLIRRVKLSFEDNNEAEEHLKRWINVTTKGEGYTSLHLAAYRGNIKMIKLLLFYGASLRGKNKYGLNCMHVAAQGDQALSLVFFRDKGIDPEERDFGGNTALHWACYSGSELAVMYLLSWIYDIDTMDNDKNTALHYAVKWGLQAGSTWIVRHLLLKGASRNARNNKGLRPIDEVMKASRLSEIRTSSVHVDYNEFMSILKKPGDCTCCMIKPPLKKLENSVGTVLLFFALFFSVQFFYIFEILPITNNSLHSFFSYFFATGCLASFLFAWLRDPGYLTKPKFTLMQMVERMDPGSICSDCEVMRAKRSRHCNFCHKCVSRFDHHCPWINNCVGLRNHGFFLSFIYFTWLNMLVIIVTISITLGENKRHISIPNKFGSLVIPNLLHYIFYDPRAFLGMSCLIIVVTFLFMLPLSYLGSVQTTNFIKGRTTSERFGYRNRGDSVSSFQDSKEYATGNCCNNCLEMCFNHRNYEDTQNEMIDNVRPPSMSFMASDHSSLDLDKDYMFVEAQNVQFTQSAPINIKVIRQAKKKDGSGGSGRTRNRVSTRANPTPQQA